MSWPPESAGGGGAGWEGQCAGAPRGAMKREAEAVLPDTGAAKAPTTLQTCATRNVTLASLMLRKVDWVRRADQGNERIPENSSQK